MTIIQLFVYGTIGDAEIFERLLKRAPVYQPARLKDYQLFVHPENGYLFVKPAPDEVVEGKLVSVDEKELALLDLWEDLPLYQRELLTVKSENGFQQAFVYTQNNTDGKPAKDQPPKSRSSIFKDIDEFLDSLNHSIDFIDRLLVELSAAHV
ncbi:MAG TPA: gamma-glutamylcyclotransferase family protein [Sunxiuqinia sp.]|nr:gamma-glutamylcyclotransferase family protein [Sunxiuqinia sp.]